MLWWPDFDMEKQGRKLRSHCLYFVSSRTLWPKLLRVFTTFRNEIFITNPQYWGLVINILAIGYKYFRHVSGNILVINILAIGYKYFRRIVSGNIRLRRKWLPVSDFRSWPIFCPKMRIAKSIFVIIPGNFCGARTTFICRCTIRDGLRPGSRGGMIREGGPGGEVRPETLSEGA